MFEAALINTFKYMHVLSGNNNIHKTCAVGDARSETNKPLVFFPLFAFRTYKDRLCTLLLFLQLVDRQGCLYGGFVRHARVQRYSTKNRHVLIAGEQIEFVLMPVVNSGVCLSGKGIGKALMSKVAQVSKTKTL